jgi:hypothetical protein
MLLLSEVSISFFNTGCGWRCRMFSNFWLFVVDAQYVAALDSLALPGPGYLQNTSPVALQTVPIVSSRGPIAGSLDWSVLLDIMPRKIQLAILNVNPGRPAHWAIYIAQAGETDIGKLINVVGNPATGFFLEFKRNVDIKK